ncbi:hypothetical protein ONZ43_g6345 [Nemania bipapillata]|uniref:Uncharacterized protein n=1 Tax=Nemania bipapillata TaxID=110536 RepID=A0ACC2I1S1_9PEZI|nr:hypothetical protein ONZ43_g6345 [Nemania bipapillata]
MIPTLARYKWAYVNSKEPFLLVEDLELYVRYLEGLTKYPLERLKYAPVLEFPAPFYEFKVQSQLPYSRLENFCGREDVLGELESFFIASTTEKSSAGRRTIVLKGMGGLGKSQTALEYIYRHPEAYTTVFWVDATDQNTIQDTGRRILQVLIAHYSVKHCDKGGFISVAVDLGIPGQIKNDGTLSDGVAKAAWHYVGKWLSKGGNSNWCLVVDGLDTYEYEDRMHELLPTCDQGHVIVTSRVHIANFKLIEVGELDEASSLRILLREALETTPIENESELEEAIDHLAMFGLIKRKAFTNVDDDHIYCIHSLVRHWAQDAKYDGESVALETDKARLQKLHNSGYLEAIILIGCSLNAESENREEREWNFERRNMTHISLCLKKYIPGYDFEANEAGVTVKVAEALYKLTRFSRFWGDDITSVTNGQLTVSLYKMLMPENPPRDLQEKMLLAMQHQVSVCLQEHVQEYIGGKPASQAHYLNIRALLEETLSRQRQLSEPSDTSLLWTECLMARQLTLEGVHGEALVQYKQCLEKTAKFLHPGHSLNGAIMNELALLYEKIGDEETARKLFDELAMLCLKYRGPNHQYTHASLFNLTRVLQRTGDLAKELECSKILAKGMEATFGPASVKTLKVLRLLRDCYKRQGEPSEADVEAITEKIKEGERLIAQYNQMKP